MRLTRLGAIAVVGVVRLFAACAPGTTTTGGDKGTVEVWSSLPRQGSSKGQTDTIINAINQALEKRGGTIGG